MGNIPHFGVDPNGEIFGITSVLLATIVKGALIGAGTGAISYSAQTAITGQSWNWGAFGKSIGMGAVSGAVAGGVGHAFGEVGKFGHELGRAFTHGITQQGVGAAFGVDPSLGGFAAGVGGSLLGSGLHNASTGVQIGGSALFGGAIAELSGGDFWQGFTTSAIVAGANHALHKWTDGSGSETGESDEGDCCGKRKYYTEEEVKNGLLHERFYAKDENGYYIKPTTGVGPAPGYGKALRAGKLLYKSKDGIYRWVKNGRVASEATLKRLGLSKPTLTTSRGKPFTAPRVETPPSGVNINPGPKTFWQQFKEAIALLGQLGG